MMRMIRRCTFKWIFVRKINAAVKASLLQIGLVGLAVGLFSTASVLADETITSDTLKIVHITDTHICDLTGYHPLFVQARQHYGDGFAPLKRFFATIPLQTRADLVVITGDLIDFYMAETANGELLDTQVERFARLADFCPVTLFCILGNHDITHYWVDRDSSYSAYRTHTHQARAAWIRNLACFRDGTIYRRDYQVGGTRYRLIFLDNGYRAQRLPVPFIMDTMQLDWLKAQLQESADDVEILFMHLPLPIVDANQDGIAFSAKPLTLDSTTVAEQRLLTLIDEHPSIRLLVTGHGHKNIIEDAVFPAGHTVTQMETGAFGQDPQNWRLLTLTADGMLISAPGSTIVEHRIPIR